MGSKLDQVLALTKELRDHEDAIKRIRFELTNMIDPKESAPKRAKKALASKVTRKVSKRAPMKNDDELRGVVLKLLKDGPMSTNHLEPAARTSKFRLRKILPQMAKDKLITQENFEINFGNVKKLSPKWVLA